MSAPAEPFLDACRVYRAAHARYASAFARGDVQAIDEAFSRMQEIIRAFRDGARWAETRLTKKGNRAR